MCYADCIEAGPSFRTRIATCCWSLSQAWILALQLGIQSCMRLPSFLRIAAAAMFGLLPSPFWDGAAAARRSARAAAPPRLVLELRPVHARSEYKRVLEYLSRYGIR